MRSVIDVSLILFIIALVLGIAATVAFLVKRVKEGGVKAAMLKAFASTLFIATGVAAYKIFVKRLTELKKRCIIYIVRFMQ